MSGEGKRNASLCVTAPFLDPTEWVSPDSFF
jgi:hypothetical protein